MFYMCEHNIYYSLCISFMKDNKASYLLTYLSFLKEKKRKKKSQLITKETSTRQLARQDNSAASFNTADFDFFIRSCLESFPNEGKTPSGGGPYLQHAAAKNGAGTDSEIRLTNPFGYQYV